MSRLQAAQAKNGPASLRPAQEPRTRRFRMARVVLALMLREIGASDARTSLGFLWSILDPIATVAILSVAFSLLTREPRLGTNFALFYVTGTVVFHLFSQVARSVAVAIRFSRNLLDFPAVAVIDALLARFLLNFLIHLIVFIVLSAGVILLYDLRVNLDIGPILVALAMAAALGMGIGTFNAVMFNLVPAYEFFWGMLNRPLMIASGVLVLIEDLPTWIFDLLWWNPAAHIVAEMRHGFYPFYDTSWVSSPYVFLVAGVTLAFGLVGLKRMVHEALEA
jgi:capsular polysaccharide transport system permease protein